MSDAQFCPFNHTVFGAAKPRFGVTKCARSDRRFYGAVSTLALSTALFMAPVVLPTELIGSSGQALAADDCAVAGNTLTCSGVITTPTIEDFSNVGVDTVVVDSTADIDSSGSGPDTGESAITLSSTGDGDLDITLQAGSSFDTTNGSNRGNRAVQIFQNAGHTGDISLVNEGTLIDTTGGTGGNHLDQNVALILESRDAFGDLSLLMLDGTTTSGIVGNPSGNSHAMMVHKIGGEGDSIIEMRGGTIDITSSAFSLGLYSYYRNGAVGDAHLIMSGGSITTSNVTDSVFGALGLEARHDLATGDATVEMTGGEIVTAGRNSHGMWAINRGIGDSISIMSDGAITTNGLTARGVMAGGDNGNFAGATDWGGDSILIMSGGSITTNGDQSAGLYARANLKSLASDVRVTQSGGSVTTSGAGSYGIEAERVSFAGAPAFNADGGIFIDQSGGSLTTTGAGSHGISVDMVQENGEIAVSAAGAIATEGDDSYGIRVLSSVPLGGDLNALPIGIDASGTIATSGARSHGVYAENNVASETTVDSSGSISTAEDGAIGIYVNALGTGDANTNVTDGTIVTSGEEASGVFVVSAQGQANVDVVGAITATGLGADGVSLSGGTSSNVEIDGIVSGGRWGGTNEFAAGEHGSGLHANVGEFDLLEFAHTAGLLTVSIGNNGALGALSDSAIQADGGSAAITNDGTVTGYVSLFDFDDSFTNRSSNSFNVRNFADTDGDPAFTRDTENVAVNDFGAGNDVFDNTATGTVRLLTVEDMSGFSPADTTDDTAPINHLTSGVAEYSTAAEGNGGTAARSITAAGVEEGHFVNLETFTHSGTITMQDAETGGTQAVWGDVLVITGNASAATGMVDGGGVFETNTGSSLNIDTFFNDGVIDMSDVLVVDSTSDAGGATSINVAAVAGSLGVSTDINNDGAYTDGEGILVVEVLGASAAGAFVLGGDGVGLDPDSVTNNGVVYTLFQSSAGGDWYLANLLDLNDVGFCNADITVSAAVGDALGCVTNDTLTVDAGGSINTVVEGAGGSDTISVLGDAVVVGTVFGGNAGQDNSADFDQGDNITINTTGTVVAVRGGDDQDIADGVSGDLITWSAGAIADGIYGENGSDTAIVTALAYDGNQILDGGDDVSATDGMVDRLTLGGLTVTANGTNITNWEIVTLNDTDFTTGDSALEVGADAGTGMFVTNGSSVDALALFALTGNLAIDATSAFFGEGAGAGIYTVSGNLTNLGTVDLSDGVAGDQLTLAGDYTGGGTLALDFDAFTNSADTLLINGSVLDGSTVIDGNNITSGDATGEDVLLVQVGGDTIEGDFTLAGGPFVEGAWRYGLELDSNDWLLRANLTDRTALYEALPGQALLNRIPTLQQRVGNRSWAGSARGATPGPAETYYERSGIWMRAEGDKWDINPDVSTTGLDMDVDRYELQGGLDIGLTDSDDDNALVLGLTGQYGEIDSEVSSAVGAPGTIETTGKGLGATLTYYDEGGFYADAQGRYTWYESDLAGADLPTAINDLDGKAYTLSLELGQRIILGDNKNWSLTPQAQVYYTKSEFDDFTGPDGELVSDGDGTESLVGRLGLTLNTQKAWETQSGKTNRRHVYLIANVMHEFKEGTGVTVSSTPLVNTTGEWMGELGLGGTMSWNDGRFSLYGEINASRSISNGDVSRYGGTVGIRVRLGKDAVPPPPPAPAPRIVPTLPPAPAPTPPPAPKIVCHPGPYIVFFDWDSSDITAEAATVLNSAVTSYGDCGSAKIMLAGHTDRSGSNSYNQALAERRNASVQSYLATRGVPQGRMNSQAFGESAPLLPTADGVRELQNRRVEINYGPGSGM